ncbi:mucoidy inhibitor MuiA family protein [Candidatus Thorarchaeota archaeon]|nr:MAG: mucoidy inhibitor MuiA family protein [Candidatus Thorarchaeota archaeon]
MMVLSTPDWRFVIMEIEASISRVAVFRNGARVTRIGSVEVEPGDLKVRLGGISSSAIEDSFRVDGHGKAHIASLDVQRKERLFEPKEDIDHIYSKLKELRRRLLALDDEIEIENLRISSMQQLLDDFSENYGTILAANETDISQLKNIDSKSSEVKNKTRKKLRELRKKRQEIQTEIEILESEIGKLDSKRKTEVFYDVDIDLEAEEKGTIQLELTYQTDGASWSPSYDVKVGRNSCRIRRMALIRNCTGEDWKDVRLRVSTATATPAHAIEGTPLYITAYDPEDARARKERAKRSMKMAPAAAAEPEALEKSGTAPPPSPPPELEETFAESSETVSGISVYDVPDTTSIPPDDEEHPIALSEEELDSSTIYYWYADEMVYVVAQNEVTNGSQLILPGEVKVYEGNDLVGETSIPQIAPHESFKIGTRIANKVKGEKKLVKRDIQKSGLTRGKIQQNYGYTLILENFEKKRIEVAVKDRVPHSLNPSIEIEVLETVPQPKKSQLGILEWELKIKEGTSKSIEYAYKVTWDKETVIVPPLP